MAVRTDLMQVDKHGRLLTRGFLFACTRDTEEECFKRKIFATEKSYGPVVIRIRKGDLSPKKRC